MLAPPPPVPPRPWPATPAPAARRWSVVLLATATVATGAWAIAITAVLQGSVWFIAESLLSLGLSMPAVTWPIVAWVNAVALALPAGLIALLARTHAPELTEVRASARAWTLAALAGGLLGTVRAVPIAHHEIILGLTGVTAAGLALVVRLVRPRPRRSGSTAVPRREPGHASRSGFALAAGLVALLPWTLTGALGGPGETMLAAVAAAGVGALAARVLGTGLLSAFSRSRPRQVLLGGLAAGIALMPIGAGLGGSGPHLFEMLILASLGFAAAALTGTGAAAQAGTGAAALAGTGAAEAWAPARSSAGLPVAVLIGVAAFGPLAFVDPEETTLLLGTADVGLWALLASVASVLLAWAAGAVYGIGLHPRRRQRGWVTAGVVALAGMVSTGAYVCIGHPGWHGDRLLVILASQADLTGIATIEDRATRLRATHRRLTEHAERTQAPLRETLRRYGLRHTPYYLLNAVRVDGGAAIRQWLAQRSDVDRVLLDQRLRPLPAQAPAIRGEAPIPDGSPQWNVQMLGADRVWRDFAATGQGIVIGTSDSGVDATHPALRDGWRGGPDSWYDPWNATTHPVDHNGHGTHTLGSALGRGGIGVAPGAQWIGCANLDRNLGSPSLYLECMQFMLAPFPIGGDPARDGRAERAPHIMTNSWGCPPIEGCDPDSLRAATAALRAAGIFFVAAAGNTGPFCSSVDDPPAPYSDVFTVGAVDRERTVTEFSSRGPTPAEAAKPDVVAPGADILSALPGGGYGALQGTSMATPHVAGVVALMWSANPRLIGDIDTTARILRQTAVPVTPSYAPGDGPGACGTEANITGSGLVDAYSAVTAARTA